MSVIKNPVMLRVLFVTFKYDEDKNPQAVLVWDEFCLDGNFRGWEEAVQAALASFGNDVEAHEEVDLVVDWDLIRGRFNRNHEPIPADVLVGVN